MCELNKIDLGLDTLIMKSFVIASAQKILADFMWNMLEICEKKNTCTFEAILSSFINLFKWWWKTKKNRFSFLLNSNMVERSTWFRQMSNSFHIQWSL